MYQADNPVEMLRNRNMMLVTPGTDWTAPTEPSNITVNRRQLRTLTQDAGWQMVYASSDAEFDRIWRDMKSKLNDFGYQEVIAYDMKNAQDRGASVQALLRTLR
jgi:multiple sugar transport system substrate-binding protein/putative aldouronate transport system substrate-binding protein